MYITNDNDVAFLINYKVCYSTFEYLKSQNILYLNNDIYDKIFNNIPIYFIVRNPINRFISFYKDKIINEIKIKKNFNQECNIKLLKFYEKDFIISDAFNIDHILVAIEKGYIDDHIKPQIELFNDVYQINKNINIIKIESFDFNSKMCNLIKIDEFPRYNNTDSISNIELNEEQIAKIQKIYIKDFIKFNYKMDKLPNQNNTDSISNIELNEEQILLFNFIFLTLCLNIYIKSG